MNRVKRNHILKNKKEYDSNKKNIIQNYTHE